MAVTGFGTNGNRNGAEITPERSPVEKATEKAMVTGPTPGPSVLTVTSERASAALEAFKASGLDLAFLDAAQESAMEALTGSAIRAMRIEYARSKKAKEAGLVPGLITDVLTGEQVPAVRARVLSYRRWRQIRPPWDMNSTEVEPSICVSLDGLRRSGGEGVGVAKVGDDKVSINVPTPVGGACASCPYSKWQDGRMACSEKYTVLAVNRDAMDTPFVITFHGTGIKAFKAAMASLEVAGMKAGWVPALRPIAKQSFATFTLGAKAVSTWYEPVFTEITGVAPDQLIETIEATASYAPTMAAFLEMDLDGMTLQDVGDVDPNGTTPGTSTRPDDDQPPADAYDTAQDPNPLLDQKPVQRATTTPPGASAGQFGGSRFGRKPAGG